MKNIETLNQEIVKLEEQKTNFLNLEQDLKEHLDIYKIDVENIDYSFDEQWSILKKSANKTYKDLKNREYNLRHNKNV